jgi:hypothetical protein
LLKNNLSCLVITNGTLTKDDLSCIVDSLESTSAACSCQHYKHSYDGEFCHWLFLLGNYYAYAQRSRCDAKEYNYTSIRVAYN